ncbi:MAG: NHL repeat-containing protein [Candidatus Binatus sp.]|uniref:NHL repeat-containing protein n=1 Tax=Candidatus Binatus sp. TaxID=2811406 RepID=UPI003D14192A
MKFAKASAFAALLLAMIGPVCGAAAGTIDTAIFVGDDYDVTAYPIDASGDVAPTAVTTDMAVPSGIARDASGRIYVTNNATNTVTVYAAGANGNVPPIATIGGAKTQLSDPTGIALDASGKIYVLNRADNRKRNIKVYPPLGTNTGILNEAPITDIAGSKTRLDDPTGIALDSQGNIYVANILGGPVVPNTEDSGTVTVYAAGSSGNIAPIATISGAATGLAYPAGIALDSSGNIYVANELTGNTSSSLEDYPSITVYPAGSKGNASPIAVIAGDNTGLDYPQGIALDSGGNLYAKGYVEYVGDTINAYPAGSNGNVSPAATIVGADTGLDGPDGIALDSGGNLYVSNGYGGPVGGGSVTIYPAGSNGDAVPIATITSSFTGINDASSIAVDSTGKIYVANEFGAAGDNGSITIYSAGSYATGAPIATIAGDNTGLSNPFGIALDSAGNIFVLNSSNAITVYPPGSAGDATPKTTINIDSKGNNYPVGMAVDPNGEIYVVNQSYLNCNKRSCYQTSPGNIAVYPAGSHDNATPLAVISGPNTNLANPSAVALDQSGDIYVTNQGPEKCTRYCGCYTAGPGSVTVYSPDSNGDVKPIATVSGPNTGLGLPYAITLDSNGNIYLLNDGGFSGHFACIVPSADGGTPAKTGVPVGGTFFDYISRSVEPILIFAAGSNGDVAPIAGIGGPFTGLYGPSAIAVGPAGP